VGFGTELLFVILLGFLILGPKQMNAMLGHVARAKAEFDKATRGFKSQLTAELESTAQLPKDPPRS
jgi:Sec-independent protein translocase protein TatA